MNTTEQFCDLFRFAMKAIHTERLEIISGVILAVRLFEAKS